MNKNKEETKKKSQVVTFRLPFNVYEKYEQFCIEEQIYMADILKKAVNQALQTREQKRA
jgi:hypothetical protein